MVVGGYKRAREPTDLNSLKKKNVKAKKLSVTKAVDELCDGRIAKEAIGGASTGYARVMIEVAV